MMQGNSRKPDPVRVRPSSVSSGGETRQVRKVHTRKVPYRVGYGWNKGGRLKELRIRHLARKFLKIWMQNAFGRIRPHKAKSHHNSVVLRRAFEGWRDEWWTSRREWSLFMRAECHHRYHLCSSAFHGWRAFTSLQREKKRKFQNAQSFADRQRMRLVWNRWEVFVEVRRMKGRMLESAREHGRLAALHAAWTLWQTRLQQRQDFYALEDQAVAHRALTLMSKTWLQWREAHTAALCQKEKESKAEVHFALRLKRTTLNQWKVYVSCLETKKKSQDVARLARSLRLMMTCWNKWRSALHHKRSEEGRLQAAGHFAAQSVQRRALERWRAYVTLCREEAERHSVACQHHHRHLISAGLQGLSLNVVWNKTHRLNNNMAFQHYHQTMKSKYWKLWQDRLEEAEDKSYQPLREKALMKHRTSLLGSCFHHWREKLAEQRHMQALEHHADVWFAERMVPLCFNSWVEFTLQRRLHKQRQGKAEVYNVRRQHSWVFYAWWDRSEKRKQQTLSERLAVLHEERRRLQGAWDRWRRQAERQAGDREKREASERLYQRRLLRRAVEKWKEFVQRQREKKNRVKHMQRYHEVKLLKHTFMAWKTHHLQMSHIYSHAEELYRQQKLNFLRNVLCVWRENTVLVMEVKSMQRKAQNYFQHLLQLKVFLAWRKAATCAASKRHQQEEAVSRAQKSINQVRLLHSLGRWRKRTREARNERTCTEKARQHHESKLLSKAMTAWNKHHLQYQKNKVMKRQGLLLLRLKMYQTYFEQWKIKLQHRRRETKQTERALWHWSLTLQAKVLSGWRLWAAEQRGGREQASCAAQAYRDRLLREGVTRILTYAAHMNDLTTTLTQHSQEQESRRLHRVVKRCACRWKQRALCKPRREQEVKGQSPKKSVTFCLTTAPGLKGDPPSDSAELGAEDGVLGKLLLTRMPRRQPRRHEEALESPLKMNTPKQPAPKTSQFSLQEGRRTELSCLHPAAKVPISSTHQTPEPPEENQGILLPPSAFMTTDTSGRLRASSEETAKDAATDQTSALIRELLSIQVDMKTYQQDRKQLRAWQRLKEVLHSWLQTTGRDEQTERHTVCQELKELEERVCRLSAELANRKPAMLLHAERIQRLQTALRASGVSSLQRGAEETQTARSVFMT